MASPRNNLKKLFHTFIQPEMSVVWIFWGTGLVIVTLAFLFFENPALGGFVILLIMVPNILLTRREIGRNREVLDKKVTSARLKSIVINLEDAVIAYDNDFRILVFNGAAEKLFGITEDRVLGETIGPDRVNDPVLTLLAQTLFPSLAPAVVSRSQPNVLPQVADISFANPEKEFRVSTDKILGDDGTPLGFVKVIKDRTREVQFIKSKSDFVSVAAHQLRTPLTAINWTLESLSQSQQLDEANKTLIQNGLLATGNLLKTVNDLLGTAEIEEGKFGYKYEEIDLIGFIDNVLANAQVIAREYGLKLYFNKNGLSELKLQADPTRLGLAISNLIDNALKYNSKNGSVTVGLKLVKDKPYVQVSIQDAGVGIAPADMERLFQKFFRAPNARKIQADGSGLGLYIAKNIIQQHGGNIWVESTLGRGTTFFFTIPTDPNLVPKAERLGI